MDLDFSFAEAGNNKKYVVNSMPNSNMQIKPINSQYKKPKVSSQNRSNPASVKNNTIQKKSPSKKVIKKSKYHLTARGKLFLTSTSILLCVTLAAGICKSNNTKKKNNNSIKQPNITYEYTNDNRYITFNDNIEIVQKEPSVNVDEICYTNIVENNNIVNNITENNDIEINNSKNLHEINVSAPSEAFAMLGEENYNKVINNYYDDILNYSNMYGLDPNFIASMIMVENPNYDKNKTENYYAMGLGQLNGEYWDGETLKVFNVLNNCNENYCIDFNNLCNNPSEQIKCLCAMVQTYEKSCGTNPVLLSIIHNKGIGTYQSVLRNNYGSYNLSEVSSYIDENDLINDSGYIGDKNYSYKIMYYMNMCLEKNVFNTNGFSFLNVTTGNVDDYVIFQNEKSNQII